MILVLFILGTMLLLTLIILLSNIRINISNLKVQNLRVNEDYKLYFQIYFINKIKIFSKKLNLKKFIKISNKKKLNKLKNKNVKFDINSVKTIFSLKPKIDMFNLNINFGNNNASSTSYLVAISNSLISILLPFFSPDGRNIYYKINPIYNKNILDIYLDSIISIKIVHIIYVIFRVIKKGMMKNERTSNRRFNAYSYE